MSSLKKTTFAVITFCFALAALYGDAQSAEHSRSFVIDQQKPYVYLKVDHVGPRKPLLNGEPNQGIWLHLVNNCWVPIVVVEVETTEKQNTAAVFLEDEVLLNPRFPVGDMAQFGVVHKSGEPNLADILLFPNLSEAATYSAETEKRGLDKRDAVMNEARPHGYNGGNPPGHRKLKVIASGEEVYFSVPLDHVSSLWHIEVPFRLALEHDVFSRPPYSYVAFFWEDLPEASRSASTAGPLPSAQPASTLLHEAGHVAPPKPQ